MYSSLGRAGPIVAHGAAEVGFAFHPRRLSGSRLPPKVTDLQESGPGDNPEPTPGLEPGPLHYEGLEICLVGIGRAKLARLSSTCRGSSLPSRGHVSGHGLAFPETARRSVRDPRRTRPPHVPKRTPSRPRPSSWCQLVVDADYSTAAPFRGRSSVAAAKGHGVQAEIRSWPSRTCTQEQSPRSRGTARRPRVRAWSGSRPSPPRSRQ